MRATLERVYRQHRQGLYTLALSITRDGESAEDAVHEAFARMCRQRTSPTGDPVAYTFAAVRNAAIDQLRRRKTNAFAEISIFAARSPLPGPDHRMIQVEEHDLLERAIDRLPPVRREAVILRQYAGLTFEQMAETLDLPISTIHSRYQRALQDLREALEAKI